MSRFSIRSRLLFASVILVAVGLVVADFATYGLLRSSLYNRVDAQLVATARTGRPSFDPGPPGFDHGPHGNGPTGPVIEQLDGSGTIVGSRYFGFGTVSPPRLPGNLPGSSNTTLAPQSRFFTTSSEDGSIRYRVVASPIDTGGTFIVAMSLDEADATLHRLFFVELSVTIAVLLALAALSSRAIDVGLRPLRAMEETASEIAQGDLSRRVETAGENTEAGRLGLALNQMLEHIESAFAERTEAEAKLRRFIADASHELRTPLTSIRGYAELFRRGADERPEDLQKSMRRIEEESARMGSLVDELLLLARLDQGRPLERARVDLVRIAADAVDDARTIQPGRPIEFDADHAVTVDGDEARLRQVVMNLLTNTLEHTPRETPVNVTVSTNGSRVRVTVADEGPGLAPEDAERIFDRFFRVDPARARENGGTGLGLSIVKAIVEAHGGTVSVQTAPEQGARFTVELPTPPDSTPVPGGNVNA